MQSRFLLMLLSGLVALVVSPLVLAHSGAGHEAGLADGFMHPVTGLDHLLIAVVAGFWAARSGRHCVQFIMLFLMLMLSGIFLGVAGLVFPQLEIPAILAFLLPALVIAVAIARQKLFAYVLFGSFAVYQGAVHILEIPSPAPVTGYAAGLLLSTCVLLATGIVLRQVVITRKSTAI